MLPAIFGISGPTLTADEVSFIREVNPFGFILFRRNIETPEQTKRLIDVLHDAVKGRACPILIDQEGGRVQRMRPPYWVDLPHVRALGDLYKRNQSQGLQAVRLHTQTIAGMLREVGFNTVCAPVVDVPVEGAHDVIGKRAFATDAETVAVLAEAMIHEFIACGITPIAKHAPGHGRAMADSHYECPVVTVSLAALHETDFAPYKQLAKSPYASATWAMTAHVVYPEIDDKPVSVSKDAITFLRQQLGIQGLIIPDAIEMEALGGTLAERALATLQAGCDVTMHCSGNLQQMKDIAAVLPTSLTPKAVECASVTAHLSHEIDWRKTYHELKLLIPDSEAYLYTEHHALNVA